ncbi:MAG: enoyl-CoA hydratase/isomerase family protein [Ilumatobacteraceae bacterium]
MRPPELRAGELVALAAARRLSQLFGTARDVPAVLVDLHDEAIDARSVEQSEIGTMPCVLIGVGSLHVPSSDLVDVVVDEVADAERLASTIAERPISSTALALLLRHGSSRTVAAGLVAESTTYSMLQGSAEFGAWRAARTPRPVPADPEPPVVVMRRDGLTEIRLNRPHRHNAVSTALSERLVEALTDMLDGSDGEERVVLAGNGPSFCSGGDLDEFGSFLDPSLAHVARLARSAGHAVHLLRDRVEARLHGACIGAGIEVPTFASRVVADPGTSISLPELALGLVPGAGGTVSLPRRIGRHRTAWLALTGASIDARTALAWGLIDEISQRD